MAGRGEQGGYLSREAFPDAPGRGLAPMQAPAMPDGSGIGNALADFGRTAMAAGVALREARNTSDLNIAKEVFLTQSEAAEAEAVRSPDYRRAPVEFADRQEKIRQEASANLRDEKTREQFSLWAADRGIVSRRRVNAVHLAQEKDANVASLDLQEQVSLRDAAAAATPVQRGAAMQANAEAIDGAVMAGWISEADAVKRKKRFERALDNADVLAQIRADPDNAAALLADIRNFPSLDPVTREQYRAAAGEKADQIKIDRLQAQARFNPETASLAIGRVIAPAHADAIFTRGVIPQESGGRADAVSSAGALGIAQLMPDTARDMARKAGRTDIAALDDAALKQKLLADPKLNMDLGLRYFREGLARYDGSIPAALAYYNAGPGNANKARADAWHREATGKFGPHYTAAQFMSLVPVSETRNYIASIYTRLGAPAEGVQFTAAHNFYRAVNTVGAELAQQDSQRTHIAKALASTARSGDDVLELVKKGFDLDPQRIVTVRTLNEQAAARGDQQAADYVAKLDHAVALAPHIRRAWALPPAQLDAAIKAMEAEMASPGGNPTTQQVQAVAAFKAVANEIKQRREAEPIVLGGENGARFYTLQPIDTQAAPEDLGFRAALAARDRHAHRVSNLYGTSANVFTAEEKRVLSDRYAQAGPNEQFRILSALGETLTGRALDDSVAAITGDSASAGIVSRMVRERPELARELVTGAALLKQKDVAEKSSAVRAALAAKLGGQVWPSPGMQDQVVKAALYLDVARRAAAGTLYDASDQSGIEKAIEDVAGKIVTRNGARVAAPIGMPASRFEALLDNLDPQTLNLFGGAYDRNGRPFDAAFIGSKAMLKQLAPGDPRYAVLLPSADGKGAPVMTYDGGPLVLDMRELAAARPQPLTAAQRGRAAFRGELGARLSEARRQATEEAP